MTQQHMARGRFGSRMQQAPAEHPELLIVGNVTRDEIAQDGKKHLGGTAAFAARAASTMGVACAVVTAAPDHFDLLRPLVDDPGIALARIACAEETAFGLQYTAGKRRLDLLAQAPDLRPQDVPHAWRQTRWAYIAPIMGECDRAMVESLNSPCIVACAQGWLRTVGKNGEVVPALGPEIETLPKNLTAIVFSELDHPDSEVLAQSMAAQGPIVALTRGKKGVSLYTPERIDVPAVPVVEVEPTGAGDVFGLVFTLNLGLGKTPVEAAQEAVQAAARVVEGPGLGNLAAWVGHDSDHRTSSAAQTTHMVG